MSERHRREVRCGRFFNQSGYNGMAVAIVAVVEYWDGEVRDWAAYIGASNQTLLEEDAAEDVAQHGCKLYRDEAAFFFPRLPKGAYRR